MVLIESHGGWPQPNTSARRVYDRHAMERLSLVVGSRLDPDLLGLRDKPVIKVRQVRIVFFEIVDRWCRAEDDSERP